MRLFASNAEHTEEVTVQFLAIRIGVYSGALNETVKEHLIRNNWRWTEKHNALSDVLQAADVGHNRKIPRSLLLASARRH